MRQALTGVFGGLTPPLGMALRASVALSNNLTVVPNNEAYDKIGVKKSFKDFLTLL
jgi:hypothetical protein